MKQLCKGDHIVAGQSFIGMGKDGKEEDMFKVWNKLDGENEDINLFFIYILSLWSTTLTLLNRAKSYKEYLQNTLHGVLHNCSSQSIGTEGLACLLPSMW